MPEAVIFRSYLSQNNLIFESTPKSPKRTICEIPLEKSVWESSFWAYILHVKTWVFQKYDNSILRAKDTNLLFYWY